MQFWKKGKKTAEAEKPGKSFIQGLTK